MATSKGYNHNIKRGTPLHERYTVTENECWEWRGSVNKGGYGTTWKNGRCMLAHRYFYEAIVGCIPDGLFVLHRCDNRKCVNPDHLFLGTQQDNVSDMIAKGRRPRQCGEINGRALLSESDVQSIRQRYDRGGITYDDLATEYNVGRSTVASVILNRNWQDAEYTRSRRNDYITNAKINQHIAAEIRQRYQAGSKQRDLAQEYGISRASICRIVNGAAWRGKQA